MRIKKGNFTGFGTVFLVVLLPYFGFAQMITGNWKGRINKQRVEVKIIQKGDSLTGTSYYYESATNYRRYSVKGYFDPVTNSAVWWDDQLIEEKSGKLSIGSPGRIPMLSRADFNCPGGGKMMLDGKTAKKESPANPWGEVHLDKINQSIFEDDWDYVIDNFLVGGNDPDLIDSISLSQVSIRPQPTVIEEKPEPVVTTPVVVKTEPPVKPVVINEEPPVPNIQHPLSNEERLVTRKKELVKEIPLTGDTLELRFYDNAEIDGDSIAVFMDNRLIKEHIRLSASAHVIKIPIADLQGKHEMVMVAENLGSIPPNTSYMVAIVGDKRYDAYLASSEGSSAMVRFIK